MCSRRRRGASTGRGSTRRGRIFGRAANACRQRQWRPFADVLDGTFGFHLGLKLGVSFGFEVLAPETGLFFGGDRLSLSLRSKLRRLLRLRPCLCGLVLFRFYLLLETTQPAAIRRTQTSSEAIKSLSEAISGTQMHLEGVGGQKEVIRGHQEVIRARVHTCSSFFCSPAAAL